MEAAKLDRRIGIERATVTTDAAGGEVQTWTTVAEVWARVDWVKDGERFRAAEIAAYAEVRFTIRWGFGVTATDRILWEGRTYEIVAPPKEIGRREGQEISAVARGDLNP
jgi:SPP1 family predicted phage head-tail adaptor